jgi:hypothetical protein
MPLRPEAARANLNGRIATDRVLGSEKRPDQGGQFRECGWQRFSVSTRQRLIPARSGML